MNSYIFIKSGSTTEEAAMFAHNMDVLGVW